MPRRSGAAAGAARSPGSLLLPLELKRSEAVALLRPEVGRPHVTLVVLVLACEVLELEAVAVDGVDPLSRADVDGLGFLRRVELISRGRALAVALGEHQFVTGEA